MNGKSILASTTRAALWRCLSPAICWGGVSKSDPGVALDEVQTAIGDTIPAIMVMVSFTSRMTSFNASGSRSSAARSIR
jgi:hypothetical protein